MRLRGFQLETLTSLNKTVTDIKYLKTIGVSIVRYPIYLSYIPDLNEWLSRLNTIITLCSVLNIRIAVCLHHPNRGNPSTQEILDVPQFYNDWKTITTRFNAQKYMIIPINEPVKMNSGVHLRQIYNMIGSTIKNRRICFAIPGTKVRELRYWKPVEGVKDQWTEVHFYDFLLPGDYNAPAYPDDKRNLASMKKVLQSIVDWRTKYATRVLIGETAINRNNVGAAEYMNDFMTTCKQFRIPYTLHAFREADIWDYEKNPPVWNVIENNLK